MKRDKSIYQGTEISKQIIFEFCYDYIKPKYDDKVNLCYMDTDIFTINIQN